MPGTKLSSCCHNGKVALEPLRPYPDALRHLMTDKADRAAKNFQENIRSYNSACAFASMGAQLDRVPGRGPTTIRLHSQSYHLSGPLHPSEAANQPQFAQLYIIDARQALQTRMGFEGNTGCLEEVMNTVQTTIDAVSPYAAAYKNMAEVEKDESERAGVADEPSRRVQMVFHRGADPRRYNAPTSHNEIAVVFVAGPDGAVPANRDLAVHPRSPNGDFTVHSRGTLKRIPELSQHCDPMV